MWYLLLVVPAATVVMGLVSRLRPMTDTDRACSSIDARLDRQQQLVSMGATVTQGWLPQQRRVLRVAARPVTANPHLLAG